MRTEDASGRPVRLTWIVALALVAWPALAAAQEGAVAGTVLDQTGSPVQNAEVDVEGTRLGDLSAADGSFRIESVPAGTHVVEVSMTGFQSERVTDVRVRPDEVARIEVTLTPAAFELDALVVSASREAQRITEAPATVTKIDTRQIERSSGNSFNGALKGTKGLEFIRTGVTTVQVNARGFNSSFNNRMLMLIDGRVGVLPENGLPVGQFTTVPKLDLESVEVLVGPGASLYGQDASNGVITLETKDPKEHPGTSVQVSKGTRDYTDVQFRHAGVLGDGSWGYKVTGEWQEADEFSNRLLYDAGGTLVPEVDADWTSQVGRGEAAVVYYEDDLRAEASAGFSESDVIGQTNVGRNQIQDWQYEFQQLKLSTDNLYFTAYRTRSQSGETFALNQFTLNRLGFPELSADSVRKLSDFPSDGQILATDFQHNFRVPELLNTKFIWGGQYRHDVVSSMRQWLTDRNTGEDIGIDQGGVFVQSSTPLTPEWNLTLGARWDDHQDYESQVSPQAGISYSPTEDQTLRLTYRQAFKSPTTLQTRFFIPGFVPFVGVFGNREGFTVRTAEGDVVAEIDPLQPEVNDTWELGYKGTIGNRLFLDVTGYYSDYQDFLGSLRPINNIAGDPPTFAHFADGELITGPQGPQIVLTYRNLGQAEIWGVDAGARYALSDRVTLEGTLSVLELSSVEKNPDDPDATALNAPPVTWTLGTSFDSVLGGAFGGITFRHTTGYGFSSGINSGRIPTFTTADVQLGYELGDGLELFANAHNLFTCRTLESTGSNAVVEPGGAGTSEPLDGSTSCGLDEPHVEMVNMPAIETTAFFGLRWNS